MIDFIMMLDLQLAASYVATTAGQRWRRSIARCKASQVSSCESTPSACSQSYGSSNTNIASPATRQLTRARSQPAGGPYDANGRQQRVDCIVFSQPQRPQCWVSQQSASSGALRAARGALGAVRQLRRCSSSPPSRPQPMRGRSTPANGSDGGAPSLLTRRSSGGGPMRLRAALRMPDHAAPSAYLILFAAAFLSALCGFNTGATLAAHHALHGAVAAGGGLLGLRHEAHSIAAAQADAELKARALRMARDTLAAAAGSSTTSGSGGGSGGSGDQCTGEEHAEYDGGFVVMWGEDQLKDSAAACCAACANFMRCNVWVWCGDPAGCGDGRGHRECWLKEQQGLNPLHVAGARGADVKWTSGFRVGEGAALQQLAADFERRLRLRENGSLPLVFLDVGIKGKLAGRIEMVLFTHTSPRSAENFRQLCTGERGIVKPGREGAGRPYHLKGRPFYRIIEGFIDQAGAEVESVFGGQFKDDLGGLRLKHDRIGLLSMANAGPDTNTAHFSIMLGPAPHLDGHYTIFGEVVTGLEVVRAVNALARGKPDRTATAEDGAFIIDSGQLRRGDPVTPAMLAS